MGSKEKLINDIYTDPENPGGFSGQESLYRSVKKKNPKITKNEIKDFLQRN